MQHVSAPAARPRRAADRRTGGILAYLKACQIDTTYLYVQVDGATLDQTLRALAAQRMIADMIVRGQGLDAAARKALVRQVGALIETLEPAPAGAFAAPGGDTSP